MAHAINYQFPPPRALLTLLLLYPLPSLSSFNSQLKYLQILWQSLLSCEFKIGNQSPENNLKKDGGAEDS